MTATSVTVLAEDADLVQDIDVGAAKGGPRESQDEAEIAAAKGRLRAVRQA